MGRLPIPAGLKPYLVPIWNEAHRIGWLVRDYSAERGPNSLGTVTV
ncbi:MAG: hypothetical protein ABSH35_35420 [Isosphaeraceae bacterium]